MSQQNATPVNQSLASASTPNESPVYRIVANLLLWACFAFSALVLHLLVSDKPNSAFPAQEILRFLDWKFVGLAAVASFMLFGLFALFGHKATSPTTKANAHYFSSLALEEWGSQVINLGSLLAACSFLAGQPGYLIGTSVAYLIGYILVR